MQHRPLLCGLLACVILAGCAGDPSRHRRQPPDAQSLQRAQALADSGYHSGESATLTLALQRWAVAGSAMPVSLAFPGQGTKLPLIVYLPGLGESAQAGSRWRQAWARAGFAVLSAQPLEFDATAWSSDLARGAEFNALARAHLKPELQAERMRRLRALLEEARRRAEGGDSLLQRVDFKRLAFAGYDFGSLGACTPRAAATLLLSPMPMEPATAARMDWPVLMVGSNRDIDLTGAVAKPQDRVQPFNNLPSGNKALLMLDGASHALLSGDTEQDGFEEDAAESAAPARVRGAHRPHSDGVDGDKHTGSHDVRQDGGRAHAFGPMQTQAIETLSIAFFDAHLRDSAQARQWLDRNAASWLAELGEWQQR